MHLVSLLEISQKSQTVLAFIGLKLDFAQNETLLLLNLQAALICRWV